LNLLQTFFQLNSYTNTRTHTHSCMHDVQYIRLMLIVSLAPIGIELKQLVLYVLLQSQFAWVLCVYVFFLFTTGK